VPYGLATWHRPQLKEILRLKIPTAAWQRLTTSSSSSTVAHGCCNGSSNATGCSTAGKHLLQPRRQVMLLTWH
jgi:hypothetical protein